MTNHQELRILFIGNSHTYCNDMPLRVKRHAEEDGYSCRVAMLAHPNWYLSQHAKEPDVRFNILHGDYDYVVLQEHAHPLGPEEEFLDAAIALSQMIRRAGSIPVLFECWSKKDEPEKQEQMNEVHRRVAEAAGALPAPVGEHWWSRINSRPETEMYDGDGAHASPAGSEFASEHVWAVIRKDLERKNISGSFAEKTEQGV